MLRLYIKPSIGRIPLTKLTPQDVQSLINQRLEDGLALRTVEYTHAILRSALGQAWKWGLVPRNVAQLVDSPRVPRKEVRPLDTEQARAFIEAVKGHRLTSLYLVAMSLGLRPGELLGLHWVDVDVEKKTARIRLTLRRLEGKLQLEEPKSERSNRTLALPKIAVEALKAHNIRQVEERLAMGPNWKESGLVFTTSIGTPLEPRNVTRHFKSVLKKADLPDQRLYDLRHTCASLLLAQGVHPRVFMEILGHSQISLTMNTYAHVMPELQREAADMMDAALGD